MVANLACPETSGDDNSLYLEEWWRCSRIEACCRQEANAEGATAPERGLPSARLHNLSPANTCESQMTFVWPEMLRFELYREYSTKSLPSCLHTP
jgi:hypothetical protein